MYFPNIINKRLFNNYSGCMNIDYDSTIIWNDGARLLFEFTRDFETK